VPEALVEPEESEEREEDESETVSPEVSAESNGSVTEDDD
jgi:hypothetical protein